MNTKSIMIEAWKTARVAAAKFGGRVSQYFAEALRMEWVRVKTALVTMVGSGKQIAWAIDIRDDFLAKFRAELTRLQATIAEDGESNDHMDARIAKLQRTINAAMAETRAKFWIDNRMMHATLYRVFAM